MPLLKEDKKNYDCIYEVTNNSQNDVYYENYINSKKASDNKNVTNYESEYKLVKAGETIKLYYNYSQLLKNLDQYSNQTMYIGYMNIELNQTPYGWGNYLTNSNMIKKFTIKETSNSSKLTEEVYIPENAKFSLNENSTNCDFIYKIVNNTDSALQVANTYQIFYYPYDSNSWKKLITTPEKTLAPNESIEFKYNVEEVNKNNSIFSNSSLKYGMAVEAKNEAGFKTYGYNTNIVQNNRCTITFTGSGKNINSSRAFSTIN